ncbi:hypothetical protein [Nocardioides lijunqiniae]|uniref:hypothetical protein n=1 Tax=Nocardioides lijunqiniae TaxID=2760832 RepID=UPI001877ABC8|nr:hypothetical protein [Nocardioides lijunqiniae]
MTKQPILGRSLAVVVALALGSTALLATAPSAQAAAPLQGTLIVSTSFGTGGNPGCSVVTDTGGAEQPAFTSNGATTARSVSSAATVEDADDAADDTSLTAAASGRVRATRAGASLATLSLTSSVSARVVAAQGTASECESRADVVVGTQAAFTLADPGWLTLRGSVQGGHLQTAVLSAQNTEGLGGFSVGGKREQTRVLFLPAGSYTLFLGHQVEAVTPSAAGAATTAASSGSVSVAFTAAGAATGPAAGKGGGFVRLDDAVACGSRSVAGALTRKAARLRTATFFVNGKRVKVIRKPRAGKEVLLRGLPTGGGVTVKVVLKPRKGRSAVVSRSYVACV